MTTQPKFHWQFAEREGKLLRDTISGVEGSFHQASLIGHGRIGNAIRLNRKDSRVNLGKVVGQFGTSDFTIAFGIKITNVHKQNDLNIISNRNVGGHGNWFSLRLEDKGRILTFEVDENNKGKNYAVAKSGRLSISDKKWHHVAIVREGRTLKVYFDGALMAERTAKTGVANIKSGVDTKLGHWTRHTPTGFVEDLRIYRAALSTSQIQKLIPPARRFLREGEIELIAADDTSVILNQDVDDLSRLSPQFQKLRLGPGTGVTLYKGKNFSSASQKLNADLPEIRHSRIKSFPSSIRIRSTVGEPFTGKWVIKAPNGRFLSQNKSVLTTTGKRTFNALFKMHQNPRLSRTQLIHGPAKTNTALKVAGQEPSIPLFVENLADRKDEFLITNQENNQWVALTEENTFSWTKQKDDRAVFVRSAKMAENEGQVGELAPGEVALYQHVAYHGRTWILSDSQKDRAGSYPNLSNFQALHDQTSSIQLGPNTGATMFKHLNFRVAPDKREKEIEDIVESVPNLIQSQIGNDSLSSLKVFKKIAPQNIFTSFSSKLSQDYRMVNDKLEEFSSYRTILRFEPGAGEIEVSATDLTTIEVEDTLHEIDEVRSVTLKPNEFNLIMITSEADGIHTPGLKFRTSDMAENERVIIFPNQEAHQQITELEDGALWNATDAQGNLIVDREARSKEEVAQVQNTMQRVMATVSYAETTPLETIGNESAVRSTEQVVSSTTIDKPWTLKWATVEESNATAPNTGRRQGLDEKVIVKAPIEEKTISSDEWAQLVSQATPVDATDALEIFGRVGRKIKNTFKKAASVVIGKVKGVVHAIVETIDGFVDIIIDTVEKIAAVVESIVERVVEKIKQFIEFLQFLFNWDDILKTQRYLVNTVNGAFGFATQLAEEAKTHVSAFVDNLQDSVEDGMNELVTMLGGDPSEVKESGFKLPEAAEWFLSKLTGGSKKSNAKPSPTLGGNPEDDSPLESFMRHFLAAFEDALGAAIRLPEGVIESIFSLITNPLKPERALITLIEAFRDSIIQSLEAVENVALGLLDVVRLATEVFQKLLNAEIKIPFISDLFEFTGAGKLTMLNLCTVLLAIPITVLSKIMFKERPFKDALPIDFSTQPKAQVVVPASQTAPNTGGKEGFSAREKSIRDWGLVSMVALFFKGIISARLDVVSETLDAGDEATGGSGMEFVSLLLDFFIWLGSFPSSPGFPGGRPYDIVTANKDAEDRSLLEKLELLMWSWRTSLFWLDIVVVIVSTINAIRTKEPNLQRLKRREEISIVIFFIFSLLDLAFTSRYLRKLPTGTAKKNEITYQVLSQLPNSFGLLRIIPEPNGSLASVVLAIIDLGMGSIGTIAGLSLLQNKMDSFADAAA